MMLLQITLSKAVFNFFMQLKWNIYICLQILRPLLKSKQTFLVQVFAPTAVLFNLT